jgi:hypothetical protein
MALQSVLVTDTNIWIDLENGGVLLLANQQTAEFDINTLENWLLETACRIRGPAVNFPTLRNRIDCWR